MTGFLEMEGKAALVTGVGSPDGIGYAVARRLAEQGMRLAITSTTNRVFDRARELPAQVLARPADLTDAEQARTLVAGVIERLGELDVLVNNAGMTQLGRPSPSRVFAQIDVAEWDVAIARNLKTAFNASRAVFPHMLGRGRGRIVNVSSVTGTIAAIAGQSAYAAAKAGMDGLTRALALEGASRGVRVNSVAPGWVSTGSLTAAERAAGARTPVGRPSSAEEVADLVVFLASERAATLTGQSIVIDGANSLQEAR